MKKTFRLLSFTMMLLNSSYACFDWEALEQKRELRTFLKTYFDENGEIQDKWFNDPEMKTKLVEVEKKLKEFSDFFYYDSELALNHTKLKVNLKVNTNEELIDAAEICAYHILKEDDKISETFKQRMLRR
ncbi:MAG: hypothetical protein ACRYGR_06865 [Janthinobacterium lividum]